MRSRSRRSSASASAIGRLAGVDRLGARSRSRSLQALQVGEQRPAGRRRRGGLAGIWSPGLIACGSTIQPARFPRRVRQRRGGERAAAARGASGRGRGCRRPASPGWCGRARRAADSKTCRPRCWQRVGRRRRGLELARRTRRRSAPAARRSPAAPCGRAGGRRTRRSGRGRRPARSASIQNVRVGGRGSGRACRAGSAPRSCGSRRPTRSSSSTGRPTGMWISLAVVTMPARVAGPGTRPPTTTGGRSPGSPSRRAAPSEATARPVETLANSRTKRMRTVSADRAPPPPRLRRRRGSAASGTGQAALLRRAG